MSETLLELRGIGASYGAIQALSNVSLKVPKGASWPFSAAMGPVKAAR